MSVQQPPPNMLQHPAMWPWSYHYAQSQMAAQAMNAAAMSLQGACLITTVSRAEYAMRQCGLIQ